MQLSHITISCKKNGLQRRSDALLSLCLLTVLVCCLVPYFLAAQQSSPQVSNTAPHNFSDTHHDDFSRLEKHLDKLFRDSLVRFDGGCALLLAHDGKIVFDKGYGSVSSDSVLPIASASKWLASALLMTFVDAHKISLSDPIGKYLRYLSGTKATITVRQLFSHTSGFAGEIPVMRNTSLTMKNAVYAICQERLKYKPGTAFAYGGASMQIGGRIVEIVGGKSWEQLFQERIARPLGMTHTTFYGLGVTENPLVAGGAKSSARDYLRFVQMIANKGVWQGKRILSEQAIAEMMSNHAGYLPVLKQYQQTHSDLTGTGEKANYGIGVWRLCMEPIGSVPQPFDLIDISSQGRLGFTPWYDVRRNIIGILATATPLRKMNPTYRSLKKAIRETVPVSPLLIAAQQAHQMATSATFVNPMPHRKR